MGNLQETERDLKLAAAALLLGLLLGISIAAGTQEYIWKRDSVRTGHAEYSAKTGAWQWATKPE